MTDPLSLRAMAELEERVARAVAVARELNPETLHQNYGPDEPADATLSNGKAAHYGWRHHVAVAKAAIAVCQSSWANEKAEMERQLAEADAVIAFELSPFDDYRPADRQAHTEHIREAIARHSARHASPPAGG